MSSTIHMVTIDCKDPDRLATFWAEGLGYKRTFEDDVEVAIERQDEQGPALLFIKVPDDKVVKNRIHFDLNPDDQEAEVARFEALGARRVDIGQKDVYWVVMADPEGNEFCILKPR